MSFIANAYTSQGGGCGLYVKGTESRKDTHELRGIWILDAWSFFTRRHDFLAHTFRRSRKKFFHFRILQASNSTSGKHRVLASSGLDARKAFLTEKSLSLGEGYKILLGGGPDLADINVETGDLDEEAHFVRQLLSLMTKDRLQDVPVFPSFVNDIYKVMAAWGSAGSIDPFTEIYNVCLYFCYHRVDANVHTAACIPDYESSQAIPARFPLSRICTGCSRRGRPPSVCSWFPSPARKAREKATAGLFRMLYTYVELRRNAAVPSSDAFDVLISQGTPTEAIVGFVLRTIFAGGMNAPATRTRCTRASRLFPLAAWEDELLALDAVIRAMLRLVTDGVVLRRSLAPGELAVGAETLAPGEFLAYPLVDVHLDPAIYPDPLRFDPGRYDTGREEDKRAPFGYLGWGSGVPPPVRWDKSREAPHEAGACDAFGGLRIPGRGSDGQPRPLKSYNIKFQRTEQ
ncbi:cytochrome P450 [Mycena albidolilacea]|uniref:Cytochrome P450 n=1 Tax=Mycena albidolilacea TaxID=1033008 RepID=A0AAD7F3K3_9AGAR|nr:cytochrome P450 [Mycena albidolilacea]